MPYILILPPFKIVYDSIQKARLFLGFVQVQISEILAVKTVPCLLAHRRTNGQGGIEGEFISYDIFDVGRDVIGSKFQDGVIQSVAEIAGQNEDQQRSYVQEETHDKQSGTLRSFGLSCPLSLLPD